MCGLVFASGILSSKDLSIFQKMLACDSFRGMHSTGVAAGFLNIDGSPALKVAKKAVNGFEFVDSKDFFDTVTHQVVHEATWKNGKPYTTASYPNFVFGHNRYATMGAVNERNAHPFQHGHITLAHNGTLTDQTLLPDHTKFEVDSENVCYSIATKGIEWTIQNLDGAFTLIWHDSERQTLNIIRNKDRPFHLLETTVGEWFGASEELMLRWLVTREKLSPTVKRHFECEPGTQYVFDVSKSRPVLVEEVKHTLPTFTRTYKTSTYYNSETYWDDYAARRNAARSQSQSNPKQSSTNPALEAKSLAANTLLETQGYPSLKVGGKVEFDAFGFYEYPKGVRGTGRLEGCLPVEENEEYVEVLCHVFDKDQYVRDARYQGTIISSYIMNSMLTIIVKDAKMLAEDKNGNFLPVVLNPDEMSDMMATYPENFLGGDDDDVPFETEVETKKLPNGKEVTQEEWDSNPNTVCGHCDHPIPFSDVDEVQEFNGAYICPTCVIDLHAEAEAAAKEEAQSGGTFCCTGCTQELPEKNRSVDYPLMCDTCAGMFKEYDQTSPANVTPLYRHAKNGMRIGVGQWNVINYCCICNTRIPFSDVESVPFIGSNPVCLDCEPKLKKR